MERKLPPVKANNSRSDITSNVNKIFQEFLRNNPLKQSLGPAYSLMHKNEAWDNLILHRMHKKFAHVTEEGALDRRVLTINNMLKYDTNGVYSFRDKLYRGNSVDPWIRRQLFQSRDKLREIIVNYRFGVNGLNFPSGETYRSTGGDVSLYAKLRDRTQWCCTPECFDLFANLCYTSPILKFAARRHFKQWQIAHNKNFNDKSMWLAATGSNYKKAFAIFKAKLRVIVTFVAGARIETVPKDLLVDRVIECDAFCNMCVQLTIDNEIKELISTHYGIDLEHSQVLHQKMLSDVSNATIDFSNASNSTWYSVVEWFFEGTRFWSHLQQSRCGFVELPGSYDPVSESFDIHIECCDISTRKIVTVEPDGLYSLNMLSPMGNGFTFSVMTLLLLGIGREVDDFCHVFGDDVIVDNDVAHQLIPIYEFIGYKVNVTKTFLDSDFKESCGGFYCDGYLTSFDFEWCNDVVDAIILINKVNILKKCRPDWFELGKLHSDLLELIPPHLQRGYEPPIDWATWSLSGHVHRLNSSSMVTARKSRQSRPSFENGPDYTRLLPEHTMSLWGTSLYTLPSLDDGVWNSPRKVAKLQKNDARCQTHYKKVKGVLSSEHNIPLSNIRVLPYLQIKRVAQVYRFKPLKGQTNGKPMKPTNKISRLFGWYYIWAGKVQAPTLRDSAYKESWTYTYV